MDHTQQDQARERLLEEITAAMEPLGQRELELLLQIVRHIS